MSSDDYGHPRPVYLTLEGYATTDPTRAHPHAPAPIGHVAPIEVPRPPTDHAAELLERAQEADRAVGLYASEVDELKVRIAAALVEAKEGAARAKGDPVAHAGLVGCKIGLFVALEAIGKVESRRSATSPEAPDPLAQISHAATVAQARAEELMGNATSAGVLGAAHAAGRAHGLREALEYLGAKVPHKGDLGRYA